MGRLDADTAQRVDVERTGIRVLIDIKIRASIFITHPSLLPLPVSPFPQARQGQRMTKEEALYGYEDSDPEDDDRGRRDGRVSTKQRESDVHLLV